MYSLKKLIAIIALGATLIPVSSLYALTVQEAVNSLQTTDVSLPAVANPKGNIGYILATIFGSSGNSLGKIQAQYLDYSGISAWTQSGSQTYLTTTTGSVGIGNVNPVYKMDVNGDIRATGTVYANANGAKYFQGGDDAALYDINVINTMGVYGVQDTTIGSLKLGSAGGTISGYNGNVGIGTTSPLATLSVGAGSLSDINLPIQISTAGVGTERWLAVNKNGAYGLLLGYENAGGLGTGGFIRQVTTDPLYFMVNSTTFAQTILSNGNVGIGTTTPGAKLEIAGQVKITGGTPWLNKVLVSDAAGLASWSSSVPLYSYSETDPSVYAWAKVATKPSYGFWEITGTVTDAQVPDNITVSYATSAGSVPWSGVMSKSLGTTAQNDASLDIWVSQYMRWKNYGNGHVIIDASNGTAPNGSVINSTNAQNVWTASYPTLMGWNGANTYGVRVDSARVADSIPWSGITGKPTAVSTWTNDSGYLTAGFASSAGQPASTALANETGYGAFQAVSQGNAGTAGAAFMSFHRPNAYATYFGLDTDNQFKVGGWSMGANSYPLVLGNGYTNNVITGTTPTASTHLATKAYVDAAVGAAGGAPILLYSSVNQSNFTAAIAIDIYNKILSGYKIKGICGVYGNRLVATSDGWAWTTSSYTILYNSGPHNITFSTSSVSSTMGYPCYDGWWLYQY